MLFERGKLSEKTQTVMSSNLAAALKEGLKAATEFWDATKTLRVLGESEYFAVEGGENEGEKIWPECLREMVAEGEFCLFLSVLNFFIFLVSFEFCFFSFERSYLVSFTSYVSSHLALNAVISS